MSLFAMNSLAPPLITLFLLQFFPLSCNSSETHFIENQTRTSPYPSISELVLAGKSHLSRNSSQLVPAFFILGDSSVDVGTNNGLLSLAQSVLRPYGRDFDTHMPTGRFCNGRLIVDYLALRLGLPFIPPYLGTRRHVQDMIHGVNYASAGGGILSSSGKELGERISFTQQIQQAKYTFEKMVLSFGENAAKMLISNSLFLISIGSNDYIHYFMDNVWHVQSIYFPWEFNQLLVRGVKRELQSLYDCNVRNVVVMGLAPLGCAPHYLSKYDSQNGECVELINGMIVQYNYLMRHMVQKFSKENPTANIIFCDLYEGATDILRNRDRYGFETITEACCGFGKYKGLAMCFFSSWACNNASNYVWWDKYHPTDAVNSILADNVWSSQHSNICYPMNLKDMLQKVCSSGSFDQRKQ
ncbi:hypothetical protein AMTR_s00021p00238930 [Amborella trichopoda]|uniref:SGNH hydrolase-type esterase domain-containing protein n=1 Tax=Amborella trichopoda TaxID=13333 RepID=W1Q0L8_AMBTC|nr:hypothetical protein AMTR_s00021p00238930 [Amborella trichopoda]